MPLAHIKNLQQIGRFFADRPEVFQPLPRPLISRSAGCVIMRAKYIPVNKLACDIILLILLFSGEQIYVPIAASGDFLDEIVARFNLEFVAFAFGSCCSI